MPGVLTCNCKSVVVEPNVQLEPINESFSRQRPYLRKITKIIIQSDPKYAAHFVIDQEGKVFQRADTCHCISGFFDSISICVPGLISEKSYDSLISVLIGLTKYYKIPIRFPKNDAGNCLIGYSPECFKFSGIMNRNNLENSCSETDGRYSFPLEQIVKNLRERFAKNKQESK